MALAPGKKRMGFTLEDIVPWGRSFDEYVAMFALSGEDLGKKIVGCGDGSAAFNAELARRGGRVLSIDPVYRFTAGEMLRLVSPQGLRENSVGFPTD